MKDEIKEYIERSTRLINRAIEHVKDGRYKDAEVIVDLVQLSVKTRTKYLNESKHCDKELKDALCQVRGVLNDMLDILDKFRIKEGVV